MPGRIENNPAKGASWHPYYPPTTLILHYEPNESPLWVIAGAFGLMVAIVVGTSLTLASRLNWRLRMSDKLAVCWFAMCGFLHCCFEGYFVLNPASLAGRQDLFAQLWKEYGLSDSRYITSDPFMISVETITVFIWGPLCLAAATCIIRTSSLKHPLQMIVCMGHLYGVALYYSTSFAEHHFRGIAHSRPEFLYFWVYYVGFNFPWVVVPLILLTRSIRTMRSAAETLGRVQGLISELQDKIEDLNHVKDEETKKND